MDGDQEQMQNLGFFAIFKESFKIINSFKKLFSQITLLFIFPLALIFLGFMPISQLLFDNIKHTEYKRDAWIKFWLFEAAYFTLLLIFSLLSTVAVVYTIACIYTAQSVHFKKVLKVVPKVWKRLIVTFLCMFFAFFVYIVACGMVISGIRIAGNTTFGFIMYCILSVLYAIGFIYMTIIWHISSVVTVLESHYGFKALLKAKDLIKGKKRKAFGVFLILNCVFSATVIVYIIFVVCDVLEIIWLRILLGLVCLSIILGVFVYEFVIQTVVYLVCKSYHNEIIDKSKLSDQLDGYLRENEPVFKANTDVQLGQALGGQHGGLGQV